MSDKFKDYAKHHLDCNLIPCTCGLDELLKTESPSPLSGEEIKPFEAWKERCLDFATHVKNFFDAAEKSGEPFIVDYTSYEKIMGVLKVLNSDMQTNGASQEKPDSSTSDGKQNNSSNSGEQQQVKNQEVEPGQL